MDETIAVKLRPVNPQIDFPRMAEIMGLSGSEPITVEDIQFWLARAPTERIQQRMVAIDECENKELWS